METPRTLLLLRHAQAVDFLPGHPDRDRPLTEHGREQAARIGVRLRELGIEVDHVLCSGARRTRETLEQLGLDCSVEFLDDLYNAGSHTILQHITEVQDVVKVTLVVGHAPGVPTLANALAEEGSDAAAKHDVERGYPTATLSVVECSGSWSGLTGGRLLRVEHG